MHEIELKVLLGSKERANELLGKLQKLDPEFTQIGESTQLNHYFVGGTLNDLADKICNFLSPLQLASLREIAGWTKTFSLRSREINGTELRLVVKATLDATSSSNGIVRREWEEIVTMSMRELDNLILQTGFQYEAKWSRSRKEYKLGDVVVCLDKNAGYGYLAEFEKMVDDPSKFEQVTNELRNLLDELGLEELDQGRLERMFAFYNEHWPDYYGTDKVFVIE